MIIWNGYGILVVPIVLFCVLAAYIITGSVAEPDYIRLHGWPPKND
jgi:hypothetical protein